MKIIFIFIIIALVTIIVVSSVTASYPEAPLDVTVSAAFVDKLSNTVLPDMNKAVRNLTLPPLSLPLTDSAGINISSFKLQTFKLGTVWFSFVPLTGNSRKDHGVEKATVGLSVDVQSLELATQPDVGFDVYGKILFIPVSCSGNFHASTSDTKAKFTIDIAMNTTQPATKDYGARGTLAVSNVSDVNINVGDLVVGQKMSNFGCKAVEDVLEKLLKKTIGQVIASLIKKEIGPIMQGALTKLLSGVFADIAVPITHPPSVVSTLDAMTVPFDLMDILALFHKRNGSSSRDQNGSSSNNNNNKHAQLQKSTFLPTTPVPHPPPITRAPDPARDVSFRIPEKSLNELLFQLATRRDLNVPIKLGNKTTTQWLRAYFPEAYELCPDCDLQVDFVSSSANGVFPPFAIFDENNASLVFNGTRLRLSALKPHSSSNKTIELFSFAIFTSVGLYNFTTVYWLEFIPALRFELEFEYARCVVVESNIGKLDPSLLSHVITYLMQTLIVPLWNSDFPGIPLFPLNLTKSGDVKIDSPVIEITARHELILAFNFELKS